MKKLLVCFAALAVMMFIACSEEEPKPTNSCVTCTNTQNGQTLTQELCNRDGNAYIDGALVGLYDDWYSILTNQGYHCQ